MKTESPKIVFRLSLSTCLGKHDISFGDGKGRGLVVRKIISFATISVQGPVSRKSRNFSGLFRMTEFSLYLQTQGVSRHETLQLFLFLFPLQHMKRPALQNKQIVILRMAFRARKVIGTFEKRAPETVRNVAGWNTYLFMML